MTVTFKETTLENGLTVIAEVDDQAESAAAGFFVKTGARDEKPANMGVSHFLEHMMFKGTEQRAAEDVDRDFDALGATHNAFTTSELTAFWVHTLPDHLADATEVLTDIMRPSIRQGDFDDEKKVILEEIAMYADQPVWVLYERAMEVYYGEHPLSHRVLGTNDTVTDMKRDEMVAYFENRYSADNTVLALAGAVDFDAAVAQARDLCRNWKRTDTARAFPAITPATERFSLTRDTVGRHYVMMLSPAPGLSDPMRYPSAMLAHVLGGHDGSRLHWAMIETGLCDEAIAEYDGRDGTGEYVAYCSCSPDDAEKAEAVLCEQMEKLVDSLEDDDLVRARSKIATGITLQGELPGGRMRRLGQLWTYLGTYRSLEEELDRVESITIDDLRAAAEQYPITARVVGTLSPAE